MTGASGELTQAGSSNSAWHVRSAQYMLVMIVTEVAKDRKLPGEIKG